MKKFKIGTMLALIAVIATTVGAFASNAGFSRSDVYTFPPPGEQIPEAYSTLVRRNNAVTMGINTSELEGGAAYTVWWVVFNNPENCSTPNQCSAADFAVSSVNSSVLWATGHVIGKNGVANFAGHLKEGKFPGQVLFGDGLTDAEGAEIHLVLRSHGQPIPGEVDEQIHTFDGGCSVNVCEDHQFAVHQP